MIKNDKELSLLSTLKGMLRKLSTFKLLKVLWSSVYLEAAEGNVEVVYLGPAEVLYYLPGGC